MPPNQSRRSDVSGVRSGSNVGGVTSAHKKSSRKVRCPRGAEDNALNFREPVDWSSTEVTASLLFISPNTTFETWRPRCSATSVRHEQARCPQQPNHDYLCVTRRSRTPNVKGSFPSPQHGSENRGLLFVWSRRIQARIQNFVNSQFHARSLALQIVQRKSINPTPRLPGLRDKRGSNRSIGSFAQARSRVKRRRRNPPPVPPRRYPRSLDALPMA